MSGFTLTTASLLSLSLSSLSLSLVSLSLSSLSLSRLSLSLPLLPCTHNIYNSEYESVFVNQRLKWRVKGNSLRCTSSGAYIEATVLAEELAYNRSLRQYKMFILERPLDPNFKVNNVIFNSFYCNKEW